MNNLEERLKHDKPKVSVNLGANLNAQNIREGIDVILECNVTASPSVFEITWTFNDKSVISNLSDGLIVSGNFLVLQKVKRSHRGNYQCIAVNSVGEGRSNHFFLRVQYGFIVVMISCGHNDNYESKLRPEI
uniref:Ig-like domain-containing protein n=1 Tax=Tetranychus urticae TaxID=32264 RepID=T1JVF2_TETUR